MAVEPTPPLLPTHEAPGKEGASVLTTAFTFACMCAGVGILQLPYTLAQGGWAMLAVMPVCLFGANLTGKLVIGGLYDDNGVRVRDNFAAIGRAAFGPVGGAAVHVFEKSTLFGVSTIFFILAGQFLEELVRVFEQRTWIFIAAAVLAVPVLLLPTLKEMKVITCLGVTATAAVVISVLVVASTDYGSDRPGRAEGPTELVVLGGFAPAFSALSLSVSCHAGMADVEAHMKNRKDFGKAMNLTYLLLGLLYLPISFVGYVAYGNQVSSPILSSLPSGSTVIAKVACTTHVLVTIPVLMHLFFCDFERILAKDVGEEGESRDQSRPAGTRAVFVLKRTVFRSVVLVACAGIAALVPYFSDVMSFVGAVCVVMTTFVMPTAFHLRLRHRTLRWWQYVVPVLVAVVGTLGGAFGAVQAVADLAHKLQAGSDA